jgi:hypothetical protein
MDVNKVMKDVKPEVAKEQLTKFLSAMINPAFGALPKREIEISVFEMMRDLGLIAKEAPLYRLMTDLKVTRSKANQLLFDLEVRKHGGDQGELDDAVKQALLSTRFAKDGDYFVLEIENPLVLAHLRQKIRELHHISDTSFNSALVRMSADAFTDLMLEMIEKKDHEKVKAALVKAGAPEEASVKSVLKSAVKQLAIKALGSAGDALVEEAGEYLGPILSGATKAITDQWKAIFKEDNAVEV